MRAAGRNQALTVQWYLTVMRLTIIARYLNPWKVKRDQERACVAALRRRDGDDCRRCRRPLRFDLVRGHDLGPAVAVLSEGEASGGIGVIDGLCLTHGRCNPSMIDHTGEVLARVRRKAEAELLAKPRRRRRA
jgi:hypothetical protein